MLPSNEDRSKIKFLWCVVALALSLLIAYCAPQASGQSDIVTVEIITDGATNYLMSGSVVADEVRVTLEFANSTQLFVFAATGGTVHFSSTHTQSPSDTFVGANAQARSGEAWRDVDVVVMSATSATPTITFQPWTPEPQSTSTPWRVYLPDIH